MNLTDDVPSPIDLQADADARDWASKAMAARPWRVDFFECIRLNLSSIAKQVRVLELGSGPGFLAQHILSRSPQIQMVLLDFSEPMHEMARERLEPYLDRVTFLRRNFKDKGWNYGLTEFSHVVANQAVHELRHKRYAITLHSAVRECLAPNGTYLMSDHYVGEDGMKNTSLYQTVDEHREALRAAGFTDVRQLLKLKGMVLHSAGLNMPMKGT